MHAVCTTATAKGAPHIASPSAHLPPPTLRITIPLPRTLRSRAARILISSPPFRRPLATSCVLRGVSQFRSHWTLTDEICALYHASAVPPSEPILPCIYPRSRRCSGEAALLSAQRCSPIVLAASGWTRT